jgi:hypothetical protein
MTLQGPIPVEFAAVFPRGAFAARGFEPVRDFEEVFTLHQHSCSHLGLTDPAASA